MQADAREGPFSGVVLERERMVRVGTFAACVALPVVLHLGVAAAAPTAKGKDRALQLFEESAQAYREGRFDDAVEKLLVARKLRPEPVLLYNLARAYEALGRWDEAADAYARYLTEEPGAVDRKAIEARITTLRTQAAELAAARRPEAAPSPSPAEVRASEVAHEAAAPPSPRRESGAPSTVPWLVAGAGVVTVAVGVGIGVAAGGAHDEAVSEPVQRKAVALQDDAESLARVSTVVLVTGVVVAAVGITWLVIARRGSSPVALTHPTWAVGQWTF